MKVERRRKKMKISVPIASMGDIAFLLIIFFMIASNFVKEAHVDLEEATSSDIETIEECKISVSVDKDAQIYLQGEICDITELQSAVNVLLETTGDNNTVMLKIDRNLVEKQYGEVLLELSKAGASLALTGIKENSQ